MCKRFPNVNPQITWELNPCFRSTEHQQRDRCSSHTPENEQDNTWAALALCRTLCLYLTLAASHVTLHLQERTHQPHHPPSPNVFYLLKHQISINDSTFFPIPLLPIQWAAKSCQLRQWSVSVYLSSLPISTCDPDCSFLTSCPNHDATVRVLCWERKCHHAIYLLKACGFWIDPLSQWPELLLVLLILWIKLFLTFSRNLFQTLNFFLSPGFSLSTFKYYVFFF